MKFEFHLPKDIQYRVSDIIKNNYDLPAYDDQLKSLEQHFIVLGPGSKYRYVDELYVTAGGVRGGNSKKVANLSFLALFRFLATLTLTAMSTNGFALFLGALIVWADYNDATTIELSEIDSSIMWTLWSKWGKSRFAPYRKIYNEVNLIRQKYGLSPISETQLRHAISSLTRIKAIKKDGENILLVETITIGSSRM